jgi:RNA polymerase-binding transcription factor
MVDIERSLRTRRRELADELARLTAPPEPGTNLSFGKRIGDGTTQAVERISSTAAARSIAASLADVDRGLQKLADDSYGYCDRCGRSIAAERLEAIPWAAFCVSCASLRTG